MSNVLNSSWQSESSLERQQQEFETHVRDNGSRLFRYLLYIFCAYLVVPIIEVPFFGLSLSAPIFFIVTLEVVFRISKGRFSFGDFPMLNIFLYSFLFGVFLSIASNVIVGNYSLSSSSITSIVRYGYWLIVFYITAIIISQLKLQNIIVYILGTGLAILTGLRLYEVVFLGKWGPWIGTQLITQNGYGILFSTFTPYLFTLIFITKYKRLKLLYSLLLIATIVAILGNGSRSNWIAASGALIATATLISLIQKNVIVGIFRVIVMSFICIGAILLIMPQESWQPVIDRFMTLERIEEDKSFAARQLMIQKGLKLFEENPLVGAGIGRFTSTSVDLSFKGLPSIGGQVRNNRRSSHNSYISLLGETGLVGTIPYAAMLLYLAVRGGVSALQLTRRHELWAIPMYASFIGMSIHLWALSGLTGTMPWFVYGMVAGMIIFCSQRAPQDRRSA